MRPSLVVLAVSGALSAASIAHAQDAPAPTLQIEPSASLFSRYELRRNYGGPAGDGTDVVRFRTRLGLSTNALPIGDDLTVRVRFAPQATGQWETGGDTLEDPALALHEGAVVLGFGNHAVDVGRFELAYGDHLVLGNVEYAPTGRAFDAVRFRIRPESTPLWVDTFAAMVDEGAGADPTIGNELGEGDLYLLGTYFGFGPLLNDTTDLDAYLLSRVVPGQKVPEANRDGTADLTIGARYRSRFGAIEPRVEAGMQLGGRTAADANGLTSSMAHQFDADVTFHAIDRKLRLTVGGFRASGDDPETTEQEGWFQLYPTGHRWLGLMDVFTQRTNLQGAVLRIASTPVDGLSLGADTHLFFADRVADGQDRFQATEIDVFAKYLIGRGVSLGATWGILLPAEDYGDETLHFAELEFRVTL